MKSGILFADGGSRGNPGPAASGAVLYGISENGDKGDEIARVGKFLGENTNNFAEYKALIIGLEMALENGITHLSVFLDSELIVKQISKEYKVKNEQLKILFNEVENLLRKFERVEVSHVKRDKNKVADSIANEVLDNKKDYS